MADTEKPQPKKNLVESIAKLLTPKDDRILVKIIELAEKKHLVNQETSAMLKGTLQISKMDVRDIMVPRIKMTWVPHDATFREALETAAESGHSRLPVLHEEKDTVMGMLLVKDMLTKVTGNPDKDIPLNDILRTPMFVPESKPLHILLQEFRSRQVHMAIVVNEYGGTSGMVTIEDIIEEITGDIKDEHDTPEEGGDFIEPTEPGKYKVDTLTPIDEFNSYFSTSFDDSEYETIGGLVLDAFGKLPKTNDTTTLEGMVFKVLAADKKRVLELELQMPEKQDKKAS